jgi:hypothetical protein
MYKHEEFRKDKHDIMVYLFTIVTYMAAQY